MAPPKAPCVARGSAQRVAAGQPGARRTQEAGADGEHGGATAGSIGRSLGAG
jgi:hypothetical protein